MEFTFKTYGFLLVIFSTVHFIKYFIIDIHKLNYLSDWYKTERFDNPLEIQRSIACIISILLYISGIFFMITNNEISNSILTNTILGFTPYIAFVAPRIYTFILNSTKNKSNK